jgi:hypothetical protein
MVNEAGGALGGKDVGDVRPRAEREVASSKHGVGGMVVSRRL